MERGQMYNKLDRRDFPVGGTETVLVAEDDLAVRDFIKYVLKDFGYTVLEASDGEEAVKIFRKNKEVIKLLLLDVIMPEKNGKEAYDAIKKIKPSIKALFISGYPDNVLEEKGLFLKGFSFIAKPVSPWDLLQKVRAVQDS